MKIEDLEKFIKEGELLGIKGSPNNKHPLFISIGGGKGGVGKSFVTANLGAILADMGFKVGVVDLDFGAPNLHTCLGMRAPSKTVDHFLNGEVEDLARIATRTAVKHLDFFGGSSLFWNSGKNHKIQKQQLMNEFRNLPYDYIIFDLGAGTHSHTLDFFILADLSIAVVTPEPTSIENSYVFMKSVLHRKLDLDLKESSLNKSSKSQLIKLLSGDLPKDTTPIKQIKLWAEEHENKNSEIIKQISNTNVAIVLNQIRTNQDIELGDSMAVICQKYFGFNSKFLGAIRYDDNVWRSIRMCKPLGINLSKSAVYGNLSNLTKEIIKNYESSRKPISS